MLARTYFESSGRCTYLVREVLGAPQDDPQEGAS
jgi:hypothetical protein